MKKYRIFSLLALVTLWVGWIVAYDSVKNEYILPSFWQTMREFFSLLKAGTFWQAFLHTFFRTIVAFLFSFLLGVVLALLASVFQGVRAFLAPALSIFRTLPTMAIILILLIWTSPAVAPIIVTSLVLFPAVYAAALAAFDEANGNFQELFQSYRVPASRRVFRAILPLGMPELGKQAGAMLSLGLKITISAEVLCNTYRSLGGVMQEAKMFVNMPTLLALTIASVLLGFLLEGVCALCVKLLERRAK